MPLFRRSSTERGDRWIVVGLGNPGPQYERTRHNVGAMVVHKLLERAGASLKSHKSGCLVADTRVSDVSVVLARPTSYMNESGPPVGALVRFYKAPLGRVIVVHDELDLPFGRIKIKDGGGTAGHKGLRSLVSHLGGGGFARVRIGISHPSGRRDPVDYVLDEFARAERDELPFVLEDAADVVERILDVGVERAMNEVNTRK